MAESFQGKGWSFPPEFDKTTVQGVIITEGEDDIQRSLQILLGTQLGERITEMEILPSATPTSLLCATNLLP